MMENANSKNSSDLSVPLFNPPTGGDICLRSKDGIEFQAHTVLLGLASSVFRDMFLVGTRREEAIDLTEDATTISIMLEFIYPNRQAPLVTSFETLDNCLRISQKYDLQSMIQTLDTQLSINTTPQSLVHSDPLRAYQLALTFDLPKTKVMAAPLITTAKADLCEPSRLSRVVQSHPSASLIRLIGIQGTRAKILADVLLGFTSDRCYRHRNISSMICRASHVVGGWICVKEMKLEQAYTPTTLPPGYYLGPTSFIKRYLLRLSSNAMTCFV
ncbi:The BTB (BR-C, ttk and bab)/POZ (Pox virus and Zinc finger) domain [Rhizoctonia solani]|uniref:The BTB (BR-C, ttk and bab)/POZ (Pox virus and Zinc finger) domain n=1 Tax=Rhizoctonia solani TaxID=456999 RepID=A0A8H8NNK7_9AGAM|nr:The BTB (BR-C, ttk and bab)/POZ (Pox virus and Zinc finger) domain [Rhizoctonia solani]QRW15813.1 The BTB (BR-C, ttk and bab)/POZ (Pox virus and Zinc finger) domain [Rhizoctonia solani]